jgi:hypothetical protein
MTSKNDALSIWALFDRPSDYPAHAVARRSEVAGGIIHITEEIILADTVDELRHEMKRRGLYWMPRQPGHDPAIVETWL